MSKDYIAVSSEWFESNLEQLLGKYRGKWAVVRLENLIGVYDSYEEAYAQGVSKAQSEEILVRKIVDKKDDKPAEISVNITLGLMNGGPSLTHAG